MQAPGYQPGVLQVSTGGGHYIGGPIQTSGGAVILGDQVSGDKVQGNKIYVDKRVQYTIEVFAVPPATPAERRQQVLEAGLAPFLPDRPFTVLEEPFFAGREDKKRDLLGQLNDGQKHAVLVYGTADVGKTSLLTAGVIPELERQRKLVIYQNDYQYPLAGLRGALVGCGERYGLALSPETTTAQLASQVTDKSGLDLVLVLDQFERYYMPGRDEDGRASFRQELAETVQALEPRRFHLIVAIRDDLLSPLDREWSDLLPGLRSAEVALDPLDFDQAFEAIITPIKAINGPGLDQRFKDQLLVDLDALDEKTDRSISPADLQIVCYQLYQAAQSSPYRTIDQSVYYQVSHNKGAEQIIDRHFDELVARLPENSQAIASEIAFDMVVDPELRFWFRHQDLMSESADSKQLENALNEMTRAGLLIWHQVDGQPAYAFASHSIRGAADRAMGRDARRRRQAGNELELIWRAWLAHDELPSPGVLNFIERNAANQPVPPERVLLLLRSAAKHAAPLASWLVQARREDVCRFIQEIEQPPEAGSAEMYESAERQTRRQQARDILGLTGPNLPEFPNSNEFGPLAWVAVQHPDPVIQEAASLAMLAGYESGASSRLEAAVQTAKVSSGRKIALQAMLADADPEISAGLSKRSIGDRLRVWGWRARRRIFRDGRYIRSVAWGGALGAGLALALLRGLLAAVLQEQPGFFFYNYFPIGFFIGGGVSLGLVLTNPLLLRTPDHEHAPGSGRPFFWALILGALGFTIAHFLLSVTLRGGLVFEAPLITVMTFVSGLGLAQAARDLPAYRPGAASTVLRILATALVFALVLGLFTALANYGVGQTYFWSAEFYRYRLDDVLPGWGLAWVMELANWDAIISLVDAALVGVALAVGLMAGMLIAYRDFARWKALEKQATGSQ